MINKLLSYLIKIKFSKKIEINWFLSDIPENYFETKYNSTRARINGSIIVLSLIISLVAGVIIMFFETFFGILIGITLFLVCILFLIRKIRKDYLHEIIEVEKFSDLICREIILILSTTKSIQLVIDYVSKGDYPIISDLMLDMLKKANLGVSSIDLLKDFAMMQPSETLKEFIIEVVLPFSKGQFKITKDYNFETQWRIRNKFDSYISQLESKMSLFLAITTIIPITVSMLMVLLGYVNMKILFFMPIVFFVFDLIAIEVFNSGQVKLLGG